MSTKTTDVVRCARVRPKKINLFGQAHHQHVSRHKRTAEDGRKIMLSGAKYGGKWPGLCCSKWPPCGCMSHYEYQDTRLYTRERQTSRWRTRHTSKATQKWLKKNINVLRGPSPYLSPTAGNKQLNKQYDIIQYNKLPCHLLILYIQVGYEAWLLILACKNNLMCLSLGLLKHYILKTCRGDSGDLFLCMHQWKNRFFLFPSMAPVFW